MNKTRFVEVQIFYFGILRSEEKKHRTSLSKSSDVLHQKYGCLPQRSPMFSFSETDEKKIKNQHAVCDSRGVFY